MPPIPIVAPTIVRFSFQHSNPTGRPTHCIMDVSMDEEGVSRTDALADMTGPVVQAWQDKMMPVLFTDLTFFGARWIDLDTLDSSSGFQPPIAGHPTTGAVSSTQLAPNTALLVHKVCGHTRSQRNGRMFFPSVQETVVDNAGIVLPAHKTAVETAFNNFRVAVEGITVVPGASFALRVVHVDGHEEPVPPATTGRPNAWSSSDITSFSVDSRVATQRRRLRG